MKVKLKKVKMTMALVGKAFGLNMHIVIRGNFKGLMAAVVLLRKRGELTHGRILYQNAGGIN